MTNDAGDELRLADTIEAAAYRDMFEAMPAPMAAATGARVVDAGGATVLIAPGIPTTLFNRAIGLGGARAATEADLDAVLAAFDEAGVKTFLVHVSDATRADGDVRAWLRARGLAPFPARPTWAKLLRGVEPPPDVASDLVVQPLAPRRAGELAAVIAAAHGMPPAMVPWTQGIVTRAGWHAYSVHDGDAIVGGGVLHVQGDRGWLGLGGTAATHRKRGAQRGLMARRIRDAATLGLRVLETETGEPLAGEANPSLANMGWAGFRRVGSRENWTRAA